MFPSVMVMLFDVLVTEYGVRRYIQQQADSARQAINKAGGLPSVSKVHGATPSGNSDGAATASRQ